MRVSTLVKSCLGLLTAIAVSGCGNIYKTPSHQKSTTTTADPELVIRYLESPTNGDSREPELNATPDGKLVLSWVEKLDDKRYALRTAIGNGSDWSETYTVAQGDNWFVNWADFPSVIALDNGSLAAHWLVKSGSGTYAYNVNIARSKDGGKTWTKPMVPHLDNTQTEHGFVSLVALSNGMLGAIWLDGRNMKDMKATKESHEEEKPLPASMTLRYAAIDAQGNLSDEAELDERVCECCQTSATVTSDGVVAVYRDRSHDEVRDIYSVRQDKSKWQLPKVVHADNWTINGCPVNGPAVAADGRNVAVAWFTGAGGSPHVYLAFSTDAGTTFGNAIQVDDGGTLGRVDVSLLADGSALVIWLAGNAEAGAIKVRRVRPDGALGPAAVLAKTDISRSSGFPRMARLGNAVHFAWTEFGKPSRIRMASADVTAYR
jgi:hypothetical protein